MPESALNELQSAVWGSAAWLASVLFLLGGFKLAIWPKLVGGLGELLVRLRLKGKAADELHDVIIPNGRGGLTQIDHLYLTHFGVAVIETKSLSGRLFGRPADAKWTQHLGRASIKIPNPFRQNAGHVNAVKALVGETPVTGFILMAADAKFPKGRPAGVVQPGDLVRAFKERADRPVAAEWREGWQALKNVTRKDRASRRQHRKGLDQRFGIDVRQLVGNVMFLFGVVLLGIHTL